MAMAGFVSSGSSNAHYFDSFVGSAIPLAHRCLGRNAVNIVFGRGSAKDPDRTHAFFPQSAVVLFVSGILISPVVRKV